ncbi:MAG: DnaB-like helicase C-terminal domain-containing protein [Vulcanimicrobiota bacterium]
MSYTPTELRLIAHDELERELIASSCHDERLSVLVVTQLNPDDFGDRVARKGLVALTSLLKRGFEPGPMALQQIMVDHGDREASDQLLLASAMATGAEVETMVDLVRERSFERRGTRALERCQTVFRDLTLPLEERKQRVSSIWSRAMAGSERQFPVNAADVARALAEERAKPDETTAKRWLATGFASLDHHCRGLGSQEVVVLAALPKHGKTSLGLQMATNMARPDAPVLWCSHEMDRRAVVERVIVQHLKRPYSDLTDGHLWQGEDWLRSRGLYIHDAATDFRGLISIVESFRLRHPNLACVCIDYLSRYASVAKWEDVAEASRAVHDLAMRHRIPVLVIEQFKVVDRKMKGDPTSDDLPGGRQLQKDAYKIWLLKRTGKAATLTISENRDGPTGEVQLRFDGPTYTFREALHAAPDHRAEEDQQGSLEVPL